MELEEARSAADAASGEIAMLRERASSLQVREDPSESIFKNVSRGKDASFGNKEQSPEPRC